MRFIFVLSLVFIDLVRQTLEYKLLSFLVNIRLLPVHKVENVRHNDKFGTVYSGYGAKYRAGAVITHDTFAPYSHIHRGEVALYSPAPTIVFPHVNITHLGYSLEPSQGYRLMMV